MQNEIKSTVNETVLLAVRASKEGRIGRFLPVFRKKSGFFALSNHSLVLFSEDALRWERFPLADIVHLEIIDERHFLRLRIILRERLPLAVRISPEDRKVVEEEIVPTLNAVILGKLSLPLGIPPGLADIQMELGGQCIKMIDASKSSKTADGAGEREYWSGWHPASLSGQLKVAGLLLACLIAYFTPVVLNQLDNLYALKDMERMGWWFAGDPSVTAGPGPQKGNRTPAAAMVHLRSDPTQPAPDEGGRERALAEREKTVQDTLVALRRNLDLLEREKNQVAQRAQRSEVSSQREMEQLKRSLAGLRGELAQIVQEKDQRLQRAIVDSNGKLRQLQETIKGLRKRLDDGSREKRDEIKRAMDDSNAQMRQLQTTIKALRQRLEKSSHEKRLEIQAAMDGSNTRMTELQGTIQALKRRLDETSREKRAEIQAAMDGSNARMTELQGTIQALKRQLDETSREKRAEAQAAMDRSNARMTELQGTIQALRKRLDETSREKRAEIQVAMNASNAEMGRLMSTIDELRNQLNKSTREKRTEIQAVMDSSNARMNQLKKTINGLRNELKKNARAKEKRVQEAVDQSHKEILLVKNSVSSLREELKKMVSGNGVADPSQKREKRWYEGGKLHTVKGSQWRDADVQNRLATAAGWLINKVKLSTRDDLKEKSAALHRCVSRKVAEGNRFAGVEAMASQCMAELKYPIKRRPGGREGLKNWYEGGTLTTANPQEWRQAHEDNQLATAATWVIRDVKLTAMADLQRKAAELTSCVSQRVKLKGNDKRPVDEVAEECIAHLNYKLKKG